ncbi:hypothetical protein CJD36_019610 [Flavipsychrobacter stenotrophus]|uniref:Uncharacterized protein n=1 Tax=Flavipsychrobacter stenotrophus TaxID=2077091 RepID=A0A2S7SRB2_9BACT|nr:T9SS type A sorting domain-containing protein [Flavipsychrobacter stenotrophus]PQJ09450.1 hypothetical protein CJD36_019610 [Flavipsychrobacter stenotrophus]
MKKIFYLFVFIILFIGKASAQYVITVHSISYYPYTSCSFAVFKINTNSYASGLSLQTYYGDGTSDITPIADSGVVGGGAEYYHTYPFSGTYSVKRVLFYGSTAVDSVIETNIVDNCQTLSLGTFFDNNGNGIYDAATEYSNYYGCWVSVDSNGITVDTFYVNYNWAYAVSGSAGDIYTFRAFNYGSSPLSTIPATAVIYDTLTFVVGAHRTKYFGFDCLSLGYGNDLSEYVSTRSSRNRFDASVSIARAVCNYSADTLTMNLSPKYNYSTTYPAPTLISGNTYKWVFSPPSSVEFVYVTGVVPGVDLMAGDTVHSSYCLNTPAGDPDLTNNSVNEVDTVRSSYDPNEKTVSPSGILAPGSGTALTYTLKFENTGTDTAFNIHILDTLSDDLDVHSLKVLTATHPVTTCVLNNGLHNVLKFGFPHINLLDSSYHGQCDGMVRFTIKTKDDLLVGTQIDNRAGIYFDYNPVVMTNTVTNIVGWPAGIEDLSNITVSNIQLFPNPAENELTVKIGKGTFTTISVVNSMGQVVMKQEINGNSTKLNVKALPAGSYYIFVKGNSGVKVERFQKM